jgi:hypothetical protein
MYKRASARTRSGVEPNASRSIPGGFRFQVARILTKIPPWQGGYSDLTGIISHSGVEPVKVLILMTSQSARSILTYVCRTLL